MRFEYEAKQDDLECVAYIDGDGDFRMKTDEGVVYLYSYDEPPNQDSNHDYWNPSEAAHKFYHGDKVTITF